MTRAGGTQSLPIPGKPVALLGQRVAFTGRFGTLTRAAAEDLVRRAAGRVAASVTARTTLLVVGMRGWPLMNDGHMTVKLAEAERLRSAGKPIRIISEMEFRETVGLDPRADAGPKSLSAEQVCSALAIDRRTLERWEHCGLVRACGGFYDFRDIVSLRAVTDLVARGVSPVVIRTSLEAISAFLPGVDRPLAQLKMIVSESGEVLAELEGALLSTSGQMQLQFDTREPIQGADAPLTLGVHGEPDISGWIDVGLEFEEAGDLEKAAAAYRRAGDLAPRSALPHFNLGNVLLAAGRLEAAAERFARAAALDTSNALAWFNLAHIEDALGNRAGAQAHLQRAIGADPTFADAHFNLADVAERLGDRRAAAGAWEAYLRLDSASDWGAEARRRLQALRGAGSWA